MAQDRRSASKPLAGGKTDVLLPVAVRMTTMIGVGVGSLVGRGVGTRRQGSRGSHSHRGSKVAPSTLNRTMHRRRYAIIISFCVQDEHIMVCIGCMGLV